MPPRRDMAYRYEPPIPAEPFPGSGFVPEQEQDSFAFSPEEEALYLPDPEDYEVEPYERQEFGGGSFFEPLAGLQNLDLPQPRSFGEGFAHGLGRGLGTFGSRAAQRRQIFEQDQAKRQALNDQERIAASRQFRADTGAGRRAIAGARLKEKQDREKFERENPALTDQDIKNNPWLAEAGYGVGSRPPERIRAIVAESRVPESPKQKADREARDARENRAINAAERANKIMEINSEESLFNQIRQDPDIKAYQNSAQNLGQVRAAAKLGTGPGDLALLIAYYRATEPGVQSVVREQEFANAQKSIGAMAQFLNLPAYYLKGNLLTEPGRKELMATAKTIAQSRRAAFDTARGQFKGRADAWGIPFDRVWREYPLDEEESTANAVKTKGMQAVEPD